MLEQFFYGWLLGTSDAKLFQRPASQAGLRPVIRHNLQFDSALSWFSVAVILPPFFFLPRAILVMLPDENMARLK